MKEVCYTDFDNPFRKNSVFEKGSMVEADVIDTRLFATDSNVIEWEGCEGACMHACRRRSALCGQANTALQDAVPLGFCRSGKVTHTVQ